MYDDRDLHFAGTLPAGGESLRRVAMLGCENPDGDHGWDTNDDHPDDDDRMDPMGG